MPTGLDFGPDGALYFGDWIDGWATKESGRIWKLDVPGEASSELRKTTKEIMQSDFKEMKISELSDHLKNPDMRIRQKA